MIDTIIFDLGGVLIDWNPEYVYRKIIPDAEKRAYFFNNICTHEWNIEQDAGRMIADATEMLVATHPDWELEIRAFYARWEDMLGGPIHDTVALLNELKSSGNVRLLALTNWSAETFPKALELYDFLQWFEGIVVSGTEKMRKPFPEIYELLLDRYAVLPENAIFIDDNVQNIEAAETAGINGVHFQGAKSLRETLAEWRVITA